MGRDDLHCDSSIVLPQLPVTEFEQSGRLSGARRFVRRAGLLGPWNPSINVALFFLVPWLAALRDYRSWELEQLALATSYLLGPHEAMLAGETSLLDSQTTSPVTRDVAVSVTAAHILVFGIDSLDGQPRRVVLAGRPADVKVERRSLVFGLYPASGSAVETCSGGSVECRVSSSRSGCWMRGVRPRPECVKQTMNLMAGGKRRRSIKQAQRPGRRPWAHCCSRAWRATSRRRQ